MKKVWSLLIVCLMMFSMMAFSPQEQAYIKDVKGLLDWRGSESAGSINLSIKAPDGKAMNFDIRYTGKNDMHRIRSYMKMDIKMSGNMENLPAIPGTIQMYTQGSDLYVDRNSFKTLVKAVSQNDPSVNEEFVKIQSDAQVNVDKQIVREMMDFIYTMDLGVDTGLVKKGNQYTLMMDSDKMVDLLNAYIKYVLTNMDKFPKGLILTQQMPAMTAEEKEKILKEYDTTASKMIEELKKSIKGSSYTSKVTMGDEKVDSEGKLVLNIQGAQIVVTMNGYSQRTDDVDVVLPKMVKTFTSGEFSELMMPKMIPVKAEEVKQAVPEEEPKKEEKPEKEEVPATQGSYLSIKIDGTYKTYPENSEGSIRVKNENARLFFHVEDLNKLLDGKITSSQEYIAARDLAQFDIKIKWNPSRRSIDFIR